MFSTTFSGLHRINKATAPHIASGGFTQLLSFVPKAPSIPTSRRSSAAGILLRRIGDHRQHATIALTRLRIGGDVVSVIGGTCLTVERRLHRLHHPGRPHDRRPRESDRILDRTDVFGLAFWGGSAYGFNNGGQLFEIDLTTGVATDIPMPNAPGLSFYAGSTAFHRPGRPRTWIAAPGTCDPLVQGTRHRALEPIFFSGDARSIRLRLLMPSGPCAQHTPTMTRRVRRCAMKSSGR
jgi:hypothetical protein